MLPSRGCGRAAKMRLFDSRAGSDFHEKEWTW
jgi:hypothetical protein